MGGLLDTLPKEAYVDALYTEEADTYQYRGSPVGWSADLKRIMALGRREFHDTDEAAAKVWTRHLRRPRSEPCDCDKRWGVKNPETGEPVPGTGCILDLNAIQGNTLDEVYDVKGGLVIVGVGHGKTGLGILLPWALFPHKAERPSEAKVVLLLIPPKLKRRFFTKDYPQWSAHFEVPNLAGWPTFIPDGRPVLEVVSYSELSSKRNTDLMSRIRPDAIVADEAHKLKDASASRTKRFKRVFSVEAIERSGKPKPLYVPMSGTMTDHSIKEYAHHAEYSLGDGSPLPMAGPVLEEWAAAIDVSEHPAPAGRLRALCEPGETIEQGFARRLFETKGVVTTSTASVKCGLEIEALPSPSLPAEVEKHLAVIRDDEVRPDGEESDGAMTTANWAREMASGFYSYWAFPREFKEHCRCPSTPCLEACEAVALIDRWFEARKRWNKAVRAKLRHSREFVDSPDLVKQAAIRWFDGYKHEGKAYPPKCSDGPLPVWDSRLKDVTVVDGETVKRNMETWPAWRELEEQVKPEPRTKWVDPFLVNAVVAWGKTHKGVIWVEHKEFGLKVAQALGTPDDNGGGRDPELDEKGDRTIVCAIRANNEGSNLQGMFYRNLVVHPPTAGLLWEQLLGRTHRQGQQADTVEVDVYLHTKEFRKAFDTAVRRAQYTQTTQRLPQKLCLATIDLEHAVDAE